MPTDPELRRLLLDAQKASERLVVRLEGYGKLVSARAEEAALADDIARFALDVERRFRGWRERTRDLREMLEDPDLRWPDPKPPEDPHRLGEE